MGYEIRILTATAKDLERGIKVAGVEKVVLEGINEGIECKGKRKEPAYCYTLNEGKGTTVYLPVNETEEELERNLDLKKVEKGNLER
jgi:hypothetical protein